MITLKFEKLYNRDRVAQPCFVSIPLAQGVFNETDKVSLKQNDKLLPLQKKVLSSYPDGSVRYLFLRFLADIPANKGTTVECEIKPDSGAFYEAASETGKMLREKTMEFCKTYLQKQLSGQVITTAEKNYTMQYGVWQVLEEGPVCVVLSNLGYLAESNSTNVEDGGATEGILCETRVTAYLGKTYYDVEIRLVNATEEPLPMTSWQYEIVPEQGKENGSIRTCVADSNYKTKFLHSEEGEAVEQSITAEFLMNQGNEHSAETFHGTFFADVTTEAGGVCATIFQAHQNFPKALRAEKEKIVIGLVPSGSVCTVRLSRLTPSFSLTSLVVLPTGARRLA